MTNGNEEEKKLLKRIEKELTNVAGHGNKDDEAVPDAESGNEVDDTHDDVGNSWGDAEEKVVEHRGDARGTSVYNTKHGAGLARQMPGH